jgi:hypothetical protein
VSDGGEHSECRYRVNISPGRNGSIVCVVLAIPLALPVVLVGGSWGTRCFTVLTLCRLAVLQHFCYARCD